MAIIILWGAEAAGCSKLKLRRKDYPVWFVKQEHCILLQMDIIISSAEESIVIKQGVELKKGALVVFENRSNVNHKK